MMPPVKEWQNCLRAPFLDILQELHITAYVPMVISFWWSDTLAVVWLFFCCLVHDEMLKARGDGAHFLLMGKSGSLSPLQTGQRMWLEVNGVETTNPSPQNTYTLNPWLHRGTRTKIDPEQRVHIEPEPCCTVTDCCCLIPVVFDMGRSLGRWRIVDIISHLEDTWTNSEIRLLFLSKARDVSPLWQKSFESSCIKLPSKESVLKLGVGKKKNLLQHIEESSINRQSDYKWNTEKAIWQGGGEQIWWPLMEK